MSEKRYCYSNDIESIVDTKDSTDGLGIELTTSDVVLRLNQLEAENDALVKEIKRLPDKLKWVSDNASHHSSSHWLKTQLYGLARELETGYMNIGTKDFYRVDALLKAKGE